MNDLFHSVGNVPCVSSAEKMLLPLGSASLLTLFLINLTWMSMKKKMM